MVAMAAPKAQRTQITTTVNALLLKRIDRVASESGWGRSEMIDRVVEFYLSNHPQVQQQPSGQQKPARGH